MNLTIHPAKPTDVCELVLRKEDAREVREGWQMRVMRVIEIEGGLAFRTPSGALAGLGGVQIDHESRKATPWLLCTDQAALYPRDCLRLAKSCVRTVIEPLSRASYFVANDIGIDCTSNRAFVKKLGFMLELNYFHFPR